MTKMKSYTAHAAVQFGAINQWRCPACLNMAALPVCMGAFHLEWCPNVGAYLGEALSYDPEAHVDSDYPFSPLLVKLQGEADADANLVASVDQEFENLELLFRLFRPGSISVRRHGFVRNPQTGGMWLSFSADSPKPSVMPAYATPKYHIHDDNIGSITEFFDKYVAVIPEMGTAVQLALSRFNSSYDRRELVDRLIDLVIALEALFTDREQGSVTFKVALRCAWWLKPPGDKRVDVFNFIKKAYSARSAVVHGQSSNGPTREQLDELESTVRACLVKFLERKRQNQGEPTGSKLDRLMLVGYGECYS